MRAPARIRIGSGTLVIMRLIGQQGYGVELHVVGYQFPHAEDLRQRHSWHLVEGTATSVEGAWPLQYPALTCDESSRLASWLRDAAHAGGSAVPAAQPAPVTLAFTEPNLSFTAIWSSPTTVVIDIGLDLEFAPPWQPRHQAGNPYLIRCELTSAHLRQAAEQWEAEIAPYPDAATPDH